MDDNKEQDSIDKASLEEGNTPKERTDIVEEAISDESISDGMDTAQGQADTESDDTSDKSFERDRSKEEDIIGFSANTLPDKNKRIFKRKKDKQKVATEVEDESPVSDEEPESFIDESVRGEADWGVYKRNYGWPYKIFFIIAIIGTAYYIFTLILQYAFGIEWTYGWSPIKWFVGVLCTGCLIGVPSMLILPYFSYRKFKRNHIEYEPKYFMYYEYFVDGNTPEGRVEMHNEYRVERMRVLEETIGYFRVRGVVYRTVVTNGIPATPEKLKKTIIPKAFTNMELIEKYLIGGKNEYHYVKFRDIDEDGDIPRRRYSSHYKKYKKY